MECLPVTGALSPFPYLPVFIGPPSGVLGASSSFFSNIELPLDYHENIRPDILVPSLGTIPPQAQNLGPIPDFLIGN